jgi:alanyl-tRNA synthetase
MLVGLKAIEDYTNKSSQVNKISSLLSLKPQDVFQGVENQSKEIEELKREISSLKNKIYRKEISNFSERENIIVYHADMEMDEMRNYCNILKEKVTNIAGVVGNGRFLMISDNVDLKNVLSELKNEFDIKGGGNSQMIQGQFSGDVDALIKKFSK